MTNLFENYQLPTKKKGGSKRADVIKDIYSLYTGDKIGRKKDNWKKYIAHLKSISRPDTPPERDRFRTSKLFIKKYPINTFCFLISHVKTDDLYLILSTAKDNKARGFNVSGYIASHFSKGVIK